MQNEIVEIYRGIEIRKYNILELRVDYSLYDKIKSAKEGGISLRKIIEKTSQPCQCCNHTEALGFNDNNEIVKVKRGILTTHTKKKK